MTQQGAYQPQVYTPYQQQAYAQYQPQRPVPRDKTLSTILIVIVVVVIILLGSCGLLWFQDFPPGTTKYYIYATQEFKGSNTLAQFQSVLMGEGFKIVKMYNSSGMMTFAPFCGAQGSADATDSLEIMSKTSLKISTTYNTTSLTYYSKTYPLSDYTDKKVETKVKCVMTKVRTVLEAKMGLSFNTENLLHKKTVPGPFEGAVLVPLAVIVVAILRLRWGPCKK